MDLANLWPIPWCFPGGSEVKVSASNAGDPGSIPGSGRSPGEGNGISHSSILAWRIPWMEKPGRLQSTGSQRVGHDFTFSLSLSWEQGLFHWNCAGSTWPSSFGIGAILLELC